MNFPLLESITNDLLLGQLLLEGKIEYISNAQGPKLLQRYNSDNSRNKQPLDNAEAIVTHLTSADPSGNRAKYLQWIVNRYLANEFKLEDLPQIKGELQEFERLRPVLQKKDINQYKSLPELYDALDPHKETQVVSGKEAERLAKKDAEVFYKGTTLTVIIPKTEAASCYYGKGTKWCTAADNADNMFDQYNRGGPLYIIITKDGRKFQFHFESNQFMDERDQDVDVEQLAKKYPELFTAFEDVALEHGFLPLIEEQTPEMQMAAVLEFGGNLEYVKEQTRELCLAAVDQYPYALMYVKNQTPEICMAAVRRLGIALEYVKKQTPEICIEAVKQDGDALQYVKEQTPEICMAAVKKRGRALRFVEEQTPEICMAAVKQDGLALKYVKEQTPEICAAAVKQNERALEYVKEQIS